jgi:hypothetical protein
MIKLHQLFGAAGIELGCRNFIWRKHERVDEDAGSWLLSSGKNQRLCHTTRLT